MFFLPMAFLMAGTRGMKMNDGIEPRAMKIESSAAVPCRLLLMKYAPAALPIDIIAKAVMKKKAMMRNGRFLTNSIHRSLILTFSLSLASITTRSLHWLKQNTRRARPMMA